MEEQLLVQPSEAFSATVSAVSDSIVRIEGRRRGPGSGIAWSADGLVLSAHHSLHRDQDLRVGLPDGSVEPAVLVGRDPARDLALLRIREGGLRPPAWADGARLQVGHLVLAVGRPGRHVQAGLGIVSARTGPWRTPGGAKVEQYVQTDVALYPGFSGSALVDVTGQVVGLNTSGLLRGLSLTLTVPTLRQTVAVLLEHGRVRQGYLGIGAYPVKLPAPAADRLTQRTGLLVVAVEPESPAEAADLIVGDVVVSLDGEPVGGLDDLLQLLSAERIGRAVPLEIVRGGALASRTVTIGERDA